MTTISRVITAKDTMQIRPRLTMFDESLADQRLF